MRTPAALVIGLTLVPAAAYAQADERASMLSWINADRAAAGRPPLVADRRLDAVAEAHAQDMATNRFFSHTSPTTGAPADRAAAAGLRFRALAENIALHPSVRAAHEALMRSPGHRANLLDGGLRRVGIGLVRGPDGVYVTQLFATLPGDAAVPAPIAAPDDTEAPVAPSAPTQTPMTLPATVDPRAWAALVAEAQRHAEALARRHGRRGRWTLPLPFEPPRVAAPSPRWDDAPSPCDR